MNRQILFISANSHKFGGDRFRGYLTYQYLRNFTNLPVAYYGIDNPKFYLQPGVVVAHKCYEVSHVDMIMSLKSKGWKLIYDIGDIVPETVFNWNGTKFLLQAADHVIVATEPIRTWLLEKQIVSNDKISQLSDPIEFWEPVHAHAGFDPIITWYGFAKGFRQFILPLDHVWKKYQRKWIFNAGDSNSPTSPTIPWDLSSWPWHVGNCDIGLAPLPDGNIYCSAKGNHKAAQYFALGLPAVVSPIWSYKQFVEEAGGKICRTDAEWEAAIDYFRDPVKRASVAGKGREIVKQRFGIETIAKNFLAIVERVC